MTGVNAPTVAIVEDEFLLTLHLEDVLLDAGYSVIATAHDLSSADAISQAPDIALVDLNLSDGLTGPEVARRLSERFGAQIIYVTANPGQIGTPASTALGVLHKPFSRQAIERALAYALDEGVTVARPGELQPFEGCSLLRSA
ncbi:response regulator [Novosphingobium sp. M1R2S20]|uniref:Response regulator n=1 Tax=Novosphingobium rhizovicinum TaxID=3228928 RepID=A0ABV3RFJ5_9SPHN